MLRDGARDVADDDGVGLSSWSARSTSGGSLQVDALERSRDNGINGALSLFDIAEVKEDVDATMTVRWG